MKLCDWRVQDPRRLASGVLLFAKAVGVLGCVDNECAIRNPLEEAGESRELAQIR